MGRPLKVHVRPVWHPGKGEERELDYTLLGLRGRDTRLSALGAKLLWAGRRAQARLEPELENLATELAHSLHDHEASQLKETPPWDALLSR